MSDSPSKKTATLKVDFQKKWTNGHKTLNAAETQAMREILLTEVKTCDNYSKMKSSMIRPRNPLTGEETPRTQVGAAVLNPRSFTVREVANGLPLFPAEPYTLRSLKLEKQPVGKIGIFDNQYDILGNKGERSSPGQPDDLFQRTMMDLARKEARKAEEEALKECKRKAHEKRQMAILERDVEKLRKDASLKEEQLNSLRTKYS